MIVVKEYYPTKKVTLTRPEFKKMLKRFTDGSIHGVGSDFSPEDKEEGEKQLEEFITRYVDEIHADTQEFTIFDFYRGFMGGQFYEWMEKNHPDLKEEDFLGQDL